MRPILAGIQRFYELTAPRDWKTLQVMRIPKHRTLPRVMIPERVWELIEATRAIHLNTIFRTSFSCGLRTGDVQGLTIHDVDRDRMELHVRTTKGLNERFVPMPEATYQALRAYWSTHRNKTWLFPSRQFPNAMRAAEQHVSARTIQRGFQDVVRSLGWQGKGLVHHTLRHSYATSMLERGVNVRILQEYLGHKNLQATEIYLHLTRHGDEHARRIVDDHFNGPQSQGPAPQGPVDS